MRCASSAAVLLCLGALACETRRPPAQDGGPVLLQGAEPASPPLALTYERPLAHRREMQGQLDSARLLLARGDTSDARRLLHRAAAFLLVHASSPSTEGTEALIATARALDSVADHVSPTSPATVRTLAALSARANLAEAQRHAARASDAWARHARLSVADELIMTMDHVERAARDARIDLSPSLRARLDELNGIVECLPNRREMEQDALDEVLTGLHEELLLMRNRLPRVVRP